LTDIDSITFDGFNMFNILYDSVAETNVFMIRYQVKGTLICDKQKALFLFGFVFW